MQWHLARDNQDKLAKFCESYKVKSEAVLFDETFNIRYEFGNGSFIEAELMRGTHDKGYTVADHFQVVNYGWATA